MSYEWKDEPLSQVIGEAIGAASTCWVPRSGKRVFDSEEAVKIVDAVMYYLAERDTKLRARVFELPPGVQWDPYQDGNPDVVLRSDVLALFDRGVNPPHPVFGHDHGQ